MSIAKWILFTYCSTWLPKLSIFTMQQDKQIGSFLVFSCCYSYSFFKMKEIYTRMKNEIFKNKRLINLHYTITYTYTYIILIYVHVFVLYSICIILEYSLCITVIKSLKVSLKIQLLQTRNRNESSLKYKVSPLNNETKLPYLES